MVNENDFQIKIKKLNGNTKTERWIVDFKRVVANGEIQLLAWLKIRVTHDYSISENPTEYEVTANLLLKNEILSYKYIEISSSILMQEIAVQRVNLDLKMSK